LVDRLTGEEGDSSNGEKKAKRNDIPLAKLQGKTERTEDEDSLPDVALAKLTAASVFHSEVGTTSTRIERE
jgi:hypothetical protein